MWDSSFFFFSSDLLLSGMSMQIVKLLKKKKREVHERKIEKKNEGYFVFVFFTFFCSELGSRRQAS